MIGIWTTKVGYHNLWEFWFFNAQYGFTMGAQFSYGQAFMAELRRGCWCAAPLVRPAWSALASDAAGLCHREWLSYRP